MTNTTVDVVEREQPVLGRRYLTFALSNNAYGLDIAKVQEITGLLQITPISRMPVCVRCVINLRKTVIPVVELRTKIGLKTIEDTDQTCVVIVQVTYGSKC